MLNKIRGTHAKKILWALAVVIIIAFGLSGAGFYLAGRGRNVIGTIDNKKITPEMYSHHIKLAKVYLLTYNLSEEQRITRRDIEDLALDFMVLLWKAKKENITVTDQEVVDYIVNLFGGDKFDKNFYENFLQFRSKRYGLALTPRLYEECVREFIKRNKLFEKYIDTSVTEDEAKDLYIKDTQKAKITYLSVPYEKFKVATGITSGEIEDFYQENKSLFEREPKVKLKYAIISLDSETAQEIQAELVKIKTIDELADKFPLDIKETDFIGVNDPIEEIGWQPQINKYAFVVEKGKILPIELGENLIIMVKEDEKEAYIPALDEIKEEVKEMLILDKARKEAEQYSQDILKEINEKEITDLKKLAGKGNVELKETDYFRYYDYIEGIGLDEKISKMIFSLQINEICPENLMLENSSVIIQLKELTPFDEKDFIEKKQTYFDTIKRNKEILGRMKFLNEVRNEANLDLYSIIEVQ